MRYTEYFMPGTEPEELRNNPWKVPQWGPLFAPRAARDRAGPYGTTGSLIAVL